MEVCEAVSQCATTTHNIQSSNAKAMYWYCQFQFRLIIAYFMTTVICKNFLWVELHENTLIDPRVHDDIIVIAVGQHNNDDVIVCSCSIPPRLVLRVQQQVEAEEGDTQRNQWREFVGDLWDNRLPHLRSEVYGDGAFVFDPHTGRYGFQEGSEFDSEGELMDDLMNEPEEDYTQRTEDEESFLLLSEEQQPSLESSREEETKREEHPGEQQEEDECEYFVPVET